MTRELEKEIKEYLEKIGLQYSSINQDDKSGEYYIQSVFQTHSCVGPYIHSDYKWALKCSLRDLVSLLEEYIQKIDEN